MEHKIGEIFEYNGEWYQCVVAIQGCRECSFRTQDYCTRRSECMSTERSDKKSVIFKKLEKIGEPYKLGEVLIQQYQGIAPVVLPEDSECLNIFRVISSINVIEIEIKQNKEDMEEKKDVKQTPLEKLVIDFFNNRVSDIEFEKRVSELYAKHSNSEKIGKNLKPFDLQKAREGKPVCTRDGRKARIICFDRRLFYKNVSYPILAVVERSDGEDDVCGYNEKGKVLIEDGAEYKDDLMMLPEKKEGWINVYRDCDGANITKDDNIYSSKEAAIASAQIIDGNSYVTTTIINWEE